MLFITLIILLFNTIQSHNCVTTKPSHHFYSYHIPLFWKIGKSSHFKANKLTKIVFQNYPICITRTNHNELIATSDICPHRGASLSSGKVLKNGCVQCPYHGWEYDKGILSNIPGVPYTNNKFGVPRFKVSEINDDVYLLPSFDMNSKYGNESVSEIYIPPEANNSSYRRISGSRIIDKPYKLITENILDIMHISFVHSFGNRISPIPFQIKYDDINEYSGKTTFHYTSGPNSISYMIAQAKFVKVENEFYLPSTTVTRVYANDMVKTIVTNCYPIDNNKSVLFYDLYRNFLTYNVLDGLLNHQMKITLDEDVDILNKVYHSHMNGYINTKYDVTQVKYRRKLQVIEEKIRNKYYYDKYL